jgi:photosystem I protein
MTKTTASPKGKFPYPFRASWALLLLAVNFLVAAIYFGVAKI